MSMSVCCVVKLCGRVRTLPGTKLCVSRTPVVCRRRETNACRPTCKPETLPETASYKVLTLLDNVYSVGGQYVLPNVSDHLAFYF